MSLQDELRAQKLATAADGGDKLVAISASDLSEVRSEAGCNMLLVYLLGRWSRVFERGAASEIAQSESQHEEIVSAYLSAGCDPEDVATGKARVHMNAHFAAEVKLPRGLTAVSFVQAMLREIHPDMIPEAHAQLERLLTQLTTGKRAPDPLPEVGASETCTFLVTGTHMTVDYESLGEIRGGAEAAGLRIFVAGDIDNRVDTDSVEIIIGEAVAVASAESDGPTEVGAIQGTDTELYLVASGPLASGMVVRGEVGTAEERRDQTFYVGVDMQQNPHPRGVWGTLVAQVDGGVTPVASADLAGTYLVARYD